jgi:hypothetical protein
VLEHLLDRAVELERVRPARAEDRPAARQDPGDVAQRQVAEVAFDEPAPALEDAHAVPAGRIDLSDDGPDDGVQPGAIAAAGEDSHRFRHAEVLPSTNPHWGYEANNKPFR